MNHVYRIGILTFHSVTNYGAVMQAIGLYSYVHKKLPSAKTEILNYQPWSAVKEYFRTGFYKTGDFGYLRKMHSFARFLKRNAKLSGLPIYSKQGLKRLSTAYDLLIAGSDEIWRIGGIRGEDFSYYLDFCGDATIRAAYAPSISEKTNVSKYSSVMREHLKKFKFLSVRDEYSKATVNALIDSDIPEVLDPTFLIDYEQFIPAKQLVSNPYILIYGQLDPETISSVKALAQSQNKKMVSVGKEYSWCDQSFPNASPGEWLWLFKSSDIIITLFYHGIIFALKNKKQFIALRHPGKKAKVDGLSRTLGFEKALLDGPLKLEDIQEKLSSLDYKTIQARIDLHTARSRDYLDSILNAIEGKRR